MFDQWGTVLFDFWRMGNAKMYQADEQLHNSNTCGINVEDVLKVVAKLGRIEGIYQIIKISYLNHEILTTSTKFLTRISIVRFAESLSLMFVWPSWLGLFRNLHIICVFYWVVVLNISVNSVIVIYKFELHPCTVYLHAVTAVSQQWATILGPGQTSLFSCTEHNSSIKFNTRATFDLD